MAQHQRNITLSPLAQPSAPSCCSGGGRSPAQLGPEAQQASRVRGAGEQPRDPGKLLLAVQAAAPSLAKVLQAPPAWPVPPILYVGGMEPFRAPPRANPPTESRGWSPSASLRSLLWATPHITHTFWTRNGQQVPFPYRVPFWMASSNNA